MKKSIQLMRAENFLLKHDSLFNISLVFPTLLTILINSYFYYRGLTFYESLRYFTEVYFMCLPLFVSLSVSFSMKGEEAIDYQYLLSNVFSKKKKLVTKSVAIIIKLFISALISIIPLFLLNVILGELQIMVYLVLLLSILLSISAYVQIFLFSTIYLNSTATIMFGGLSLLITAIASMIIGNYLFLAIPWVWGTSLVGLLLQGANFKSLAILIVLCTGVCLFLTYISITLIEKKEC